MFGKSGLARRALSAGADCLKSARWESRRDAGDVRIEGSGWGRGSLTTKLSQHDRAYLVEEPLALRAGGSAELLVVLILSPDLSPGLSPTLSSIWSSLACISSLALA